MPKLIINQFHAGLAPRYSRVNWEFLRLGPQGSYADGAIDPLLDLGILSPGATQLTDPTNVAVLGSGKRIQNWAPWIDGSTQYYFGIENGVQLQKIDTSTNTLDSPNFGADIAAHGGHATPIGQDIVIYQKNGSRKVFYAWADNTDGDVGTIDTDGTNQEDDFMSTSGGNDPTGAIASTALFDDSAFPIILEAADNNFLYMFQKNIVHKFDGTTNGGAQGIFSGTVVDLPFDWIIKDARDGKSKMWIMAQQSASGSFISGAQSKAGVYVWDRVSTVVKFDDFIPIVGASHVDSLFFHDGIPHCFTRSTEVNVTSQPIAELRKYNGREFEVVRQVGLNNFPYRRGVFPFRGMIGWTGQQNGGTNTGGAYAYGKPYGELSEGLYNISDIATMDTLGAVIKANQQDYYLSYLEGSTARLKVWSPDKDTQTSTNAFFKTLVYDLPKLARVTGVTVFWQPLASAGAAINLAVSVYKNMATTASKTFNIGYDTDGTKGWFYQPIGTDNWNQIQIGLAWPSTATAITSSIRVNRIEIDYETTGKLK